MPLHFRRTIRIAPGIRITLGRRGISSSASRQGIDLSHLPSTTTRRRRRRTSTGVTWWQWLIVSAGVLVMLSWWFGWL